MIMMGMDIMIYDKGIEQVLSMKYLGTYINNNLSHFGVKNHILELGHFVVLI